MSPIILKILLMANDIHVEMPKEQVAQVRAQEKGRSVAVKDCYPWFKENNYKCPSPRETKK